MTFFAKHSQVIMWLSVAAFVLTFIWSSYELQRTGSIRAAGSVRQRAQQELLALEEEALALDQLMRTWAVVDDASREIKQRISQTFTQAQFPAAQFVGDYRLHQAEIRLTDGTLHTFFENLEKLQGLPMRVRQVDLGVQDDNQAVGLIEIVWLERL